jgi:hypothetical protein
LRNGITPAYYCAAGLYHRRFSWKQKREFLSEEKYQRRLSKINDPRYGFVTHHKIVTYGVLRTFGIPTPRVLGLITGCGGWAFDGYPLQTPSDLEGLFDRVGMSEVCFKLVGGWSGFGFHKVRIERHTEAMAVVFQPEGRRMTVDEFWRTAILPATLPSNNHKLTYGYLCQEVVDQHPAVAALHPESLNTARLWLFQSEPGKWEVFEAILKMGWGQMCIDNGSAGGIFARIDRDSGRVDAALSNAPERPGFPLHPSTGFPIEGFVVPMWDQAMSLSSRACAAFPYMRLLGVDIAFSRSGPLVMELEAAPHSFHQAGWARGVSPLLDRLERTADHPVAN